MSDPYFKTWNKEEGKMGMKGNPYFISFLYPVSSTLHHGCARRFVSALYVLRCSADKRYPSQQLHYISSTPEKLLELFQSEGVFCWLS